MQSKFRSALLGVCIVTCFALVSSAPAFAASKPVVKTTEANEANGSEETVNGTVNPEGLETKYYFEYGTSSYEKKTAEVSTGPGTTTLEVGARLTGLKLSTKYQFRIVATNGDGKAEGNELTFTTTATTKAPEFKPSGTEKFTGKLSKTHWSAQNGAFVISCTGGSSSGEILTGATVGKFVLSFTGCLSSGAGGNNCPVESPGEPEGQIVTSSLSGELGTVPSSEFPSGVGLLITGTGGTEWGEWEENTCIVESAFGGDLAAEVKVVGKKQTSNTLVMAKQPKNIALDSGKLIENPILHEFGFRLTIEGQDELTFPEATEVT